MTYPQPSPEERYMLAALRRQRLSHAEIAHLPRLLVGDFDGGGGDRCSVHVVDRPAQGGAVCLREGGRRGA